jgi:hypothetical protein
MSSVCLCLGLELVLIKQIFSHVYESNFEKGQFWRRHRKWVGYYIKLALRSSKISIRKLFLSRPLFDWLSKIGSSQMFSVLIQSNARQNHYMKVTNKSLENVSNVRYLGRKLINRNFVSEENYGRLHSGNFCRISVQNISTCHLKDVKVK